MDDTQTTGSDGIEEAMSHAVGKIRDLAMNLQNAPVTEEHIWYRNLLLGILISALQDYQYVEIGVKRTAANLAAWGCRNLLELKVITTYVLTSAENATQFKNDFVVDVKEFYEAISKRHKAGHPKLIAAWREAVEEFEGSMREAMEEGLQSEIARGAQTEATDEEAATYQQLMVEFGIPANTKPKRSGEIAKLISQSAEFDPMFKVCSKIMHRTALSIAASATKGGLDAMIPLLSSTAAMELLSIHEQMEGYFLLHGVQPPNH
jgi:hypothetical protein